MFLNIVKNTTFLLFVSIFEKIVNLCLIVPCLTKMLRVESLGKIEMIASFFAISSIVITLNFSKSFIRFGNLFKDNDNEKDYLSTLLIGVLGSGLLFVIVVKFLDLYFFFEKIIPLNVILVWIISSIVKDFFSGYLKYTGRTELFVGEKFFSVGLFAIIILYCYYYGDLDVEKYFLVKTYLSILSIIFFYGFKLHKLLVVTFNREIIKESIKFTFPFMLSSLFIIGFQQIDKIMIGGMINLREVGFYSVGLKLANVFKLIPVALSASLASVFFSGVSDKLIQKKCC